MLALGHARFGASQIDDHVGPFSALDDAVHELADAAVIFVVDGIAFRFAHFLHDHLLCSLRGDAAEHVGGLGYHNFAAHDRARIDSLRFSQREFFFRVGNFLDHGTHGEHVNLPGVWIELCAEVFFGLVIFPRGNNHRVFNRRDDHLRFNVLFPADLLDCLVQQTGHFSLTLKFHNQVCLANTFHRHGNHPALHFYLDLAAGDPRQTAFKKFLILHRFNR